MRRFDPALAAIAFLFLVNGLVFGAWATNIPHIKSAFGLGEAGVGTVLLAVAAGAVAFMTLCGAATRRLGSRGLSMISALVFAAALPLVFLAGSLPALYAAAVMLGAGTGAMDVTMNQQASLLELQRGRAVMSGLHGGFSIGTFGGALLTYGAGLAGIPPLGEALWLLAAIAAAAVLLFPHLLADQPEPKAGCSGRRRGGMFGHLALWALGLLSFLTMMSEGGIADWSTLYVLEHSDAPPGQAPLGFAAYSALMILARLTGDRMVMRLGPRAVVRLSGGLVALGMALALSSGAFAAQLAGFAVTGFGIANLIPVIFSGAARLPGLPRGAGITFVSVAGYSGFLIGPVLISGAAEAWGLDRALLVIVLVGVVMAGAARRFPPGRPVPAAPETAGRA